jgi:hypothetical protein
VLRFFSTENPEDELRRRKKLGTIRELYPYLAIDYLARKGEFSPEIVDALSRELDVPRI